MYPDSYGEFEVVNSEQSVIGNDKNLGNLEAGSIKDYDYVLLAKTHSEVCISCRSNRLTKNGLASRKKTDIDINGKYIQLHLQAQRYSCKECKQVFTVWPKSVTKSRCTSDALVNMLKQMHDEKLTLRKAAERLGVSRQTITNAFKDETLNIQKYVASYRPCHHIFIYPSIIRKVHVFYFGGIDETGEPVMFDILVNDDKHEELIKDFHTYLSNPDAQNCTDVIHMPLDFKLRQEIEEIFDQYTKRAVWEFQLTTYINKFRNEEYDGITDEKCAAIDELTSAINSLTPANADISFIDNWWNSITNQNVSQYLWQLKRFLSDNNHEVINLIRYREQQKKCSKMIQGLENDVTRGNWSAMTLRYFALGISTSRNGSESDDFNNIHCLSADSFTKEIYNFSISLSTFNDNLKSFSEEPFHENRANDSFVAPDCVKLVEIDVFERWSTDSNRIPDGDIVIVGQDYEKLGMPFGLWLKKEYIEDWSLLAIDIECRKRIIVYITTFERNDTPVVLRDYETGKIIYYDPTL